MVVEVVVRGRARVVKYRRSTEGVPGPPERPVSWPAPAHWPSAFVWPSRHRRRRQHPTPLPLHPQPPHPRTITRPNSYQRLPAPQLEALCILPAPCLAVCTKRVACVRPHRTQVAVHPDNWAHVSGWRGRWHVCVCVWVAPQQSFFLENLITLPLAPSR